MGSACLRGVSDSSLKDREASQTWVWEGSEGELHLEGAGPVDRDPTYLDSFRGELVGVLALVYVLCALLDFTGTQRRASRYKFLVTTRP